MDEEAKRRQKDVVGTAGVPTTSFSDGEDTGSEAMRSSQWREIPAQLHSIG
jgi:hypothetical protein